MLINQTAATTNVSQSEPPKQQWNAASADRRPTLVGRSPTSSGNLFTGWGPRLGN
jgi:hypothetical protein